MNLKLEGQEKRKKSRANERTHCAQLNKTFMERNLNRKVETTNKWCQMKKRTSIDLSN